MILYLVRTTYTYTYTFLRTNATSSIDDRCQTDDGHDLLPADST